MTEQILMTEVPNLLPPLPPAVEQTWRKVLNIFSNEAGQGHGDILTPTQVQIVDVIGKRRYKRTQLILPTQYGKSMAVADGVLLRVAMFPEKWAIVAPTEDKAKIIMDYIIDRIFDSILFSEQLEYKATKEKLKQERSKTRITFRDGGEVRVYSGNANNTKQTKSALMGFGAPNIILDEAGQISDELYSTVKRMVGGAEGTEAGSFLLEIGNPVFRNHFYRTWFGNRYKKIFVDCYQALKEGRYTQDFLDEMKEEAGFEWMYECKFPEESEVLGNGYRRLVSDSTLNEAFLDNPPELDDSPILGIDPAGTGSNQAKFVLRFPALNYAMVAATSNSDDLEELADIAEKLIGDWHIKDYRTVIDAGGVGHGLPAILRKRGYLVKPILFGEKEVRAGETVVFKVPRTFLNIRAWMYWEARNWLRDGGRLQRDPGFMELKLINYKQNSSLKTQIEPKQEMLKRLSQEGVKVESPDTADAFILTFVDTGSIVDEDDIYVD